MKKKILFIFIFLFIIFFQQVFSGKFISKTDAALGYPFPAPKCTTPTIPTDPAKMCTGVTSSSVIFNWNAISSNAHYTDEICPGLTTPFGDPSCQQWFVDNKTSQRIDSTGYFALPPAKPNTWYVYRVRTTSSTASPTCNTTNTTDPSGFSNWSTSGVCKTAPATVGGGSPPPGGSTCWNPTTGSGSINGQPQGSTISVNPGAAYTLTCDFGSHNNHIYPIGGNCTYDSTSDNLQFGRFNCTAPTASGTYPVQCQITAGPSTNYGVPVTTCSTIIFTAGTLNIAAPAATTGTIQGYKVKMPGNLATDATINSQTVTLDGGSNNTNNPYGTNYGWGAVSPGNHIVSVPLLTGYTIGYTLCSSPADVNCGAPNDPNGYHSKTPASGSSVNVEVTAGGSIDLWWHYTPSSKTPPCYIQPPLSTQLGITAGVYGYGDVSGDGQVDKNDANLILDFVAFGKQVGTGPHQFTASQIEAADVNGQPNVLSSAADVDSTDATMILSWIAGGPSFTACPGLTPTPTPTPSCPLKNRGDADCNGRITTADFSIWSDEFLKTSTALTSDFDNSGDITTADFSKWSDGFLDPSLPHGI